MPPVDAFDQWFLALGQPPASSDHVGGSAQADDPPPQVEAEFIARLFEQSGVLLRGHSDREIAFCLDTVINPSTSDTFFSIFEDEVGQTVRARVVAAMLNVFRDVMVPRCDPVLSHLDEPCSSALNSMCYMWWDVIPLYSLCGDATRARLDTLVLQVMERTLGLQSVACQESALHGLGHWAVDHRTTVEPIIDRYLADNRHLRPELRAYAKRARVGSVL